MKRLIFILISFFWISIYVDAQVIYPDQNDSTNQNQVSEKDTSKSSVTTKKSDVIFQHDGTKMFVDVKRIYLNDLYYSLPGDSKVNKMDQRLVHKIEYKSGKVEVLNETAPDVREVGDYRKVKVTEDPDDVEGLIEVAKLEAKSEGSDKGYATPKSLERTAIIVLRRKAALVNADIVLIIEKKSNVAFGEIPATTLYGIAYSYR
ncbi:MAG TPA: hypothetical protein DCG75_02295 [Bacteroidales bacterium]|jgi:hypothetical protein|nr:hypothetical protein [Bacteroidales bacterium]